jgi:hypothetical protein
MEMTPQCRLSQRFPKRSTLLAALLIVPASLTIAAAASNDQSTPTPATTAAPQATSEFPYSVKFDQGAIQFQDGDKITIHEIRGTAPTFAPGNIYWIRGMYARGSHDHALLAAYTTAKDAAHGTSDSYFVQHMNVDKGTGTFTLFLPMLYGGWPHVSFYAGGESIGGNYFGTGESVPKMWWGSKESDK